MGEEDGERFHSLRLCKPDSRNMAVGGQRSWSQNSCNWASDYPNQVNNSLGFPGIFRGTLDVRAKTITDEMCIAAALELARIAREKGLSEEEILPSMDDWGVFPREAVAVARKAVEQGVARVKKSSDDLYQHAESVIRRSREMAKAMLSSGYIQAPPQ